MEGQTPIERYTLIDRTDPSITLSIMASKRERTCLIRIIRSYLEEQENSRHLEEDDKINLAHSPHKSRLNYLNIFVASGQDDPKPASPRLFPT